MYMDTYIKQALDLVAKKTLQDEKTLGVSFPYVTRADGSWDTMLASESAGYRGENWSHGNWFCGFTVGVLLAAYLHTKDHIYLKYAEQRMRLVAQRADDGNTHDIGFIFLSSALPFYRITGDTAYRDIALQAADKLRSRLVVTDKGAYISSWGPMDDIRGKSSSAIDTMANIPLLYWAGKHTKDASFILSGIEHTKMTMRAFCRSDDTLYHAVEYDTTTGERLRRYTFQGAFDESYWSRGTGWAVMGLACTAHNTGDITYLDQAIALSDKWFECLGDKIVPPYDFDSMDSNAPEDSSASAIMAAGVLDVADLHPDKNIRATYKQYAIDLLQGLCNHYLATEDTHRGILKHGCYSAPHNQGTDAAVMFGDYFFVEALMRLAFPNQFIEKYTPIL